MELAVKMAIFGIGKPNVEKLKIKKDVKGLVKALHYSKSQDIRREATKALDNLSWEPSNDTEKSYILLGKENWEELSTISTPAIEILRRSINLVFNRIQSVKDLSLYP